ncbi:uncharacterized protein EHS24_007579 [Apiotrichum porosum]|uniref:Lysoplasmalogenase n=1 Tax=Apiotrichum porosum TaxID=105984 RepID=A0A427XV35_9TREE|nr:uncharacterized protein EHS24_007579 [Apiotrichum porosum]RSH82595.1 hypothetical protein EHS24_007579 [Apiotrichum porosum]
MSQLRQRQRTGANGGLASGSTRPFTSSNTLVYGPYALACVANMGFLSQGIKSISEPLKLVLMPLLALAVLVDGKHLTGTPKRYLLSALFFSWVGDNAAVLLPFLPYVPAMLLTFGIAHVAYIPLFLTHASVRPSTPAWAGVYLLWWAGMLAYVGPHAGALFTGIAAYGVLLGGTSACSSRCSATVIAGAIFFLTSDTLLAFRLFMGDLIPAWTAWIIMGTYEVGQGLIAAGVLGTTRQRRRRGCN